MRAARAPQGTNWTASGGTFSNGNGAPISNPGAYFSAVAANTHGYNASYSNGHGVPISNPAAYYSAVARCGAGARRSGLGAAWKGC